MIKRFQEWINENTEPGKERDLGQEAVDIQRLFDLGIIDHLEFTRGIKSIDPDGWLNRLVQELESRHSTEPDIWGKPEVQTRPYHTIEFTLNSDMVNMPEQHYNNYGYELLWEEPITVVIYLGGDSNLELRASYANDEFEEEYGAEEDQYDATWTYNGLLPIFRVEDILTIIEGFNNEVDNDTIENSSDWSHD